jgi:16S rRNA (guanine(1405)-N(7))-methyltransferase
MEIKKIAKDVLKKKELKNLNEKFAEEKIIIFLKENPKIKKKLEDADEKTLHKKKEYKELIKEIRNQLRILYGVFITNDYSKREKYLEELKEDPSLDNHKKILLCHRSSIERIDDYEEIYKKIFSITGKPKKVLDLACGLNPISYIFMNCKPEYFASDLSKKDMDFLQKYFDIMKIKGKTKDLDLVKDYEELKEISKDVNITFLFKALDSLETIKKNITKEIMPNIKSKHIIVSFPTASIGGRKKIKKEKRNWFEKLIKKSFSLEHSFETKNEFFYVIKVDR